MKNTAFKTRGRVGTARFLIPLLVLGAVFFVSETAQAAYFQQGTSGDTDTDLVNATSPTTDFTYENDLFLGNDGFVRRIILKLSATCTPNTVAVALRDSSSQLAVSATTTLLSSGVHQFDFDGEIEMQSVRYLDLLTDTGCSDLTAYGVNGVGTGIYSGVIKPYIQIQYEIQGVNFTWRNYEEYNNANMTDFDNWEICLSFDPEDIDPDSQYYVNMFFNEGMSAFGGTEEDNSTRLYTAEELTTVQPRGAGCLIIPKQTALDPNKLYSAVAILYNDSDEIVSESSPIRFRTVSGDPTLFMQPLSKFILEEEIDCEPTDFRLVGIDFGFGVCKTLRFLFYPSEEILTDMSDKYDELQTKFPFAYVNEVVTAAEGIEEGTETTGITLTSAVGATSFSINLLDKDEIETYAGSGVVDIFRSLTSVALYVMFGFFVFHQIKGLH